MRVMREFVRVMRDFVSGPSIHRSKGPYMSGVSLHKIAELPSLYGVATSSRLLKSIGLFCRISSLL